VFRTGGYNISRIFGMEFGSPGTRDPGVLTRDSKYNDDLWRIGTHLKESNVG